MAQQQQRYPPPNGGRGGGRGGGGRGGGPSPYPNYAATTAGRGGGPRPPMGAWQPAQPTQQQQQQPPQPQYAPPVPQTQQQQQQQQGGGVSAGQPQPQPQPRVGGGAPGGGGGGGMAPPPQTYMPQQQHPMAPPPYYNPYAAQQPPNPYAARPQWQGGGGAYGNNGGGMRGGVFYPQAAGLPPPTAPSAAVVPPPVRERKPLVITDKDGNPIDFSNSAPTKKKTTPPPAPVTPSTVEKAREDAGAKLRQAALERLEADKQKSSSAASATATVAPKKQKPIAVVVEEEKKVAVVEATPSPPSKSEGEETTKAAAAVVAKEKATPAAVVPEPPKPVAEKELTGVVSSLAALALKEERAAPPPVPKAAAEEELTGVVSSLAALALKEESSRPPKAKEGAGPSSAPQKETAAAAPPTTKGGRLVYTKEALLRLKDLPICLERPADLPPMTIVSFEARGDKGRGGGGDHGRRGSQRGDGGGGDQWARGSAPPRRQSSQGDRGGGGGGNAGGGGGGGGGEWSRGQAPPRQQPGQKGDHRGGRGGRGGRNQPPLYDGPVAPLVKSENHWRPRKNTSAIVVAEKKVKALLNKMTKEKFDRLSEQMLEIPILSYEILTMMIDNVYDKAIDEPSFGDMYAALCVRLSQHVQGNDFVHIIESDEEPPTDDGETAPEPDEESSNTVYRWSNDVSTSDSEIVGPFSSEEECMDAAFDEEEREPVERGDTELELVSVFIKRRIFIKIMKKKGAEDGEEGTYYVVYFPASEAEECGQQLSEIFLSEVECQSDANKKNSFKRSLLNKCEEEFNKQDIYADWKKEKEEYAENKSSMTDAERAEKEEELNFRRIRIKKQMLGNVKFIGQLFKANLLKEKIMRYCIASTLELEERDDVKGKKNPEYKDTGKTANIDEEDHEAICSMFATIGATIDKPHAAEFMNVCFLKISQLSKSKDLPSRSRFMYKDLLDLRSNNWVPRRKEEKAKTIAEIRQDVEREERRQAQQSAQHSRGGQGDYRGGRGGGGGDYRRQSVNSGPRNARPKPAATTDDDGFTTITTGRSVVAPRSPYKSSSGKDFKAPPAGSKPMFSVLAADDSAAASKPAASSEKAPLSKDQLERKIKSMRNDFVSDGGIVDELLLTWEEIAATPDAGKKLVARNADYMMECKENERLAIYKIIALLCEKGKLTKTDVQEGVMDAIEFIDSMVMDSPRAYEYLGDLLGDLLRIKMFDMAWLCDQFEKTKVDDPNTQAPEKLVRFTLLSLKKSAGADAVKAQLGEKKLAGLLGPDKLKAIAAEF